jgi:leucine dehydrogenase
MFTEEHEVISYCNDPVAGLKAIIAIHSTQCGPALGGTRIFRYASDNQALVDVLKLSRAMTYKAAAAELPFGGAKAVIISDPFHPEKRARLKSFCRFINLFGGNFQTGEDVGTSTDDILFMRKFTDYAHCTLPDQPEHLQTSSLTARGVLNGIQASLRFYSGSENLSGRRVAVQGLGKVGYRLAQMLHENGARLAVSDLNPELVSNIHKLTNCNITAPEEIYSVDCDVFAPCAMGQILNKETVPQLKAKIVAGCANNQLDSDDTAELLRRRGILYAPDYVINAGGLISAVLEMKLESESQMLARVDSIGQRLLEIYDLANREQRTTVEIADRKVKNRLDGSRVK